MSCDVDGDDNVNNSDTCFMYGKDRYEWSHNPIIRGRTSRHNIITHLPGIRGNAKESSSLPPDVAWKCLFTDDIIDTIVRHTNEEIERKRCNYSNLDKATFLSTTKPQEMKAFFGLLYLAGAFKSAHEDLEGLYARDGTGRDIFPATMALKRLLFLLSSLRFDDKETRDERKKTNKLAAISDVFDKFIVNCQRNYSPSEYLTIDEMLAAFRGRCIFKIYIPSKPNKYGIKIMILADAKTHYLVNAHVYVGKEDVPQDMRNFSVPTQHVLRLVTPVEKTNRNISGDCWLSSIEVAEELKNRGLTYVGMMRKNKRQIPTEFLPHKKRSVGSSIFGFNGQNTLVSHVPKKKKSVILLSTMHHNKSIDGDTQKPEIIHFYNMTKGGVDSLDQKVSTHSTARRTRRWPMVIFFAILDIAAVNGHILMSSRKEIKSVARREFIISLGKSLVHSELLRRSRGKELPRELRQMILKVGNISVPRREEEGSSTVVPGKRKRCTSCPRGRDRKAGTNCEMCNKPLCAGCAKKICPDCFD